MEDPTNIPSNQPLQRLEEPWPSLWMLLPPLYVWLTSTSVIWVSVLCDWTDRHLHSSKSHFSPYLITHSICHHCSGFKEKRLHSSVVPPASISILVGHQPGQVTEGPSGAWVILSEPEAALGFWAFQFHRLSPMPLTCFPKPFIKM